MRFSTLTFTLILTLTFFTVSNTLTVDEADLQGTWMNQCMEFPYLTDNTYIFWYRTFTNNSCVEVLHFLEDPDRGTCTGANMEYMTWILRSNFSIGAVANMNQTEPESYNFDWTFSEKTIHAYSPLAIEVLKLFFEEIPPIFNTETPIDILNDVTSVAFNLQPGLPNQFTVIYREIDPALGEMIRFGNIEIGSYNIQTRPNVIYSKPGQNGEIRYWLKSDQVLYPTDNDSCPTDPNKTEPGRCGCGFPEDCKELNILPYILISVFGAIVLISAVIFTIKNLPNKKSAPLELKII